MRTHEVDKDGEAEEGFKARRRRRQQIAEDIKGVPFTEFLVGDLKIILRVLNPDRLCEDKHLDYVEQRIVAYWKKIESD